MEIKVVNVKCGDCGNTVKKKLENIGAKNIEVCFSESDTAKNRTIKFEGNYEKVKEKLTGLGYPEVGTEEAKSILKKMKSFISCASGKIGK